MDFVEELRDDFLICNICFEEYREPKQLPCLHTFCRGCLSKYIVGKVLETGNDWFPCPFCRKPIHSTQGGEPRTWADNFPINFFLSQLSSKLQSRISSDPYTKADNAGETTTKATCAKHAKMALAAYCTQKHQGVCEECCVQTHLDCIQYHVSERDSRAMAEERKLKLKQDFDLMKIRLEGLIDKVNSHVTDLNSRKERLQLQTEAAVSDVKSKLELIVLEQKREMGRQLDMLVDREKRRMAGVRERALEVSRTFQKMSETMATTEEGSCPAVGALLALDEMESELKKQKQIMDSTRKDSSMNEIVFYPDKSFETLFRKITFGTLSIERKQQDSTEVRPRPHRYSSDPSPYSSTQKSRNSTDSVLLVREKSTPVGEAWEAGPLTSDHTQQQRGRLGRRVLSPPGAAASAAATPATEGGTGTDCDAPANTRHALEGPKNSTLHMKRSPTVPDFLHTAIEESRSRSRSLPRRRRPKSEGAYPPGRRRQALRSTDDPRDVTRESDQSAQFFDNAYAVLPSHTIVCQVPPGPTTQRTSNGPPSSSASARVPDEWDNTGAVSTSEEEFSSLGSEASHSFPLCGGTGASSSPTNSLPPHAGHSCDAIGGDQAREPMIVCVRNFVAVHESDVKNSPGIVGLSGISRDRVVVTDRWNKCIKLVDISGRIIDSMCFSEDAEPWDVALRKPGVLAVTYPKEQKIRMVDVALGGTRLLYHSHFTTRDGYASLATYSPTSLVASVCPPFGNPKVHVIDYMGVILRSIDCATVAYPRCVDMCGGGEICVSDWTNHNIKIFSRDGTLKHTYCGVSGSADTALRAPMGLSYDGHGSVFVVDGKTAKLHVVSTETGQCSVIFSLAEMADAEMKLVTFVDASRDLCQNERALIVTTTTGAIQVYDFFYRAR